MPGARPAQARSPRDLVYVPIILSSAVADQLTLRLDDTLQDGEPGSETSGFRFGLGLTELVVIVSPLRFRI